MHRTFGIACREILPTVFLGVRELNTNFGLFSRPAGFTPESLSFWKIAYIMIWFETYHLNKIKLPCHSEENSHIFIERYRLRFKTLFRIWGVLWLANQSDMTVLLCNVKNWTKMYQTLTANDNRRHPAKWP